MATKPATAQTRHIANVSGLNCCTRKGCTKTNGVACPIAAAAITTGLEQDAAQAAQDSQDTLAARMAAGRSSLLREDGSLTTWLRAGSSFGGALRSLLD